MFYASSKSAYENSASGGAFYELARHALTKGYLVCGAALEEDCSVTHMLIDSTNGLKKLQGSKYVQSNIYETFEEIERHIQRDQKVLFSGTPCQIAALKTYLNCDCSNLLTIDIVCHGTPSPGFWRRHVQENYLDACGAYPTSIRFRTKVKYDQYGYIMTISHGNTQQSISAFDELFYSLFMNNMTLRECCYQCRYANLQRVSDITLGDCASVDSYPEMKDKSPVSIVLANTGRGVDWLKQIQSSGHWRPLCLDREAKYNAQLNRPAPRPADRESIYSQLLHAPYSELKTQFLPKQGVARKLRNVIKRFTPWWLRAKLKGFFSFR